MADLSVSEIADKAAKGEKLSDDETRTLMSSHEQPPPPKPEAKRDTTPPAKITGVTDVKQTGDSEQAVGDGKPAAAKSPEPGAEKTPDKTGQAAEPAPKAAAAPTPEAAKTGDTKDDAAFKARIEAELHKPAGTENLEGLSAREKAYFYEMRVLRNRAQEAENRSRTTEFENLKLKKELDDAKGPKKDPKDLATHEDVEGATKSAALNTMKELMSTRLELDMIKHQNLPFFAEVMRIADGDPTKGVPGWITGEDQKKLVQDAMNNILRGGSPVKVAYDLIMSDPRWPARKAEIEAAKTAAASAAAAAAAPTGDAEIKAEEARQAKEKLKGNADKAVTTGAAAGGDGGAAAGEYDPQKLYTMSVEEFSALPKKEQEAILKAVR